MKTYLFSIFLLGCLLVSFSSQSFSQNSSELKPREPEPIPLVQPREAASLILSRNPNNKPPPAYITQPVEKFFNALQKGDVDNGFTQFLANSEHIQQKYNVDEFVSKTKLAFSSYGAMSGFELYDNRMIGSRMMYLTYFMYLKSVPLRWRLIFYAADGQNWKLINLSVDDLLDQSLLLE